MNSCAREFQNPTDFIFFFPPQLSVEDQAANQHKTLQLLPKAWSHGRHQRAKLQVPVAPGVQLPWLQGVYFKKLK